MCRIAVAACSLSVDFEGAERQQKEMIPQYVLVVVTVVFANVCKAGFPWTSKVKRENAGKRSWLEFVSTVLVALPLNSLRFMYVIILFNNNDIGKFYSAVSH